MGHTMEENDRVMLLLACLASVHGHNVNFGFIDNPASELILANYDFEEDKAEEKPVFIGFNKGRAYPAPMAISANPLHLSEFSAHFETDCVRWCGQPAQKPLKMLGLFIEHTKRMIATSETYLSIYDFLDDQTKG